MTGPDLAAIEARIRAFESRTGVEAVAAVVDRSDRYHGLRWRAFAVGTSLAALGVVTADVLRPDWTGAHAALVTAVTILAAGLACAPVQSGRRRSATTTPSAASDAPTANARQRSP